MIQALIVAGGSGSRMRSPIKKQYLHLEGLPLLAHTVMTFDRIDRLDRIVLAVPREDIQKCRDDILGPLTLAHDVQLVAGGRRRQDSVVNGLNAMDGEDGLVMIHDGVRPFVTDALIERCLTGAQAAGACIPAIPATDTLKSVGPNGYILETLNRKAIHLAQTPQTFNLGLIKRAHQYALDNGFSATDDASVAEFAGASVMVVPGDPYNIKITTPHDLAVAKVILDTWNRMA